MTPCCLAASLLIASFILFFTVNHGFRYGQYPFTQAPRATQTPTRQLSNPRDAFEFPTPMTANQMLARRTNSDVSDDSRDRSEQRRPSTLMSFIPRNTHIPRVSLSNHRQSMHEFSSSHSHGSNRRASQSTATHEPSLHRNGTGLSTEDLFFSRNRPRFHRSNTLTSDERRPNQQATSVHHATSSRPRLRRQASSFESEGQDSRGRPNDAFEDDALRPYYLASEQPEVGTCSYHFLPFSRFKPDLIFCNIIGSSIYILKFGHAVCFVTLCGARLMTSALNCRSPVVCLSASVERSRCRVKTSQTCCIDRSHSTSVPRASIVTHNDETTVRACQEQAP